MSIKPSFQLGSQNKKCMCRTSKFEQTLNWSKMLSFPKKLRPFVTLFSFFVQVLLTSLDFDITLRIIFNLPFRSRIQTADSFRVGPRIVALGGQSSVVRHPPWDPGHLGYWEELQPKEKSQYHFEKPCKLATPVSGTCQKSYSEILPLNDGPKSVAANQGIHHEAKSGEILQDWAARLFYYPGSIQAGNHKT